MTNSNASRHWTAAHGKLLLAVTLDPKEVGRRIAAAREKKGWTQLHFAVEVAHVSPSSVTRWESGKLPPIRELIRIAELLGVSPSDLVDESEQDAVLTIAQLESDLRETRLSLDLLREIRDAVARIEARLPGGANAAQSG